MECNSEKHISALHPGPLPTTTEREICGNAKSQHSCSKISPVIAYPAGKREEAKKMYAVLDEQSNKSLAKSEFFHHFNITTSSVPYTLKTCSEVTKAVGRRATNFVIESVDGKIQLPLPNLIECDMIPDDHRETPSPEVARHHPHLQRVADRISPVDEDAPILMLFGRDILRVHKVREQINRPHSAPYAQRLDLGSLWVKSAWGQLINH